MPRPCNVGVFGQTTAGGKSATPRMSPDNTCAMPPGVKCGRRECLISDRLLASETPNDQATALMMGHEARPRVDTRERSWRGLTFLNTTPPWCTPTQIRHFPSANVASCFPWCIRFRRGAAAPAAGGAGGRGRAPHERHLPRGGTGRGASRQGLGPAHSGVAETSARLPHDARGPGPRAFGRGRNFRPTPS